MRILKALLLIVVLVVGVCAQGAETVESLSKRLDGVSDDIQRIESKTEQLAQMQSMSNEVISNGLSASNRLVSAFGIIVTIVAVGLGIYVSKMEKRIKRLRNDVEEKESTVRELVNQVNKDIDGLYVRIRKADTKSILERLTEVPQDIANVNELLLARELQPEDFSLLKTAFLKLLDSGDFDLLGGLGVAGVGDQYAGLFIQHFLAESLKDATIRPHVLKVFEEWTADDAFPNDLEKAARDIAPILKDSSVDLDRKDLLRSFVKGLKASRYKDNKDLLAKIKGNIDNDALWEEVKG
jgi:uncharacterized protein YoxC